MSMNVNDGAAASRQYEAHRPFWGWKMASLTTPAWQNNSGKSYAIMVVATLAFSALFAGLFLGVQSLGEGPEWMERFGRRGFQLVGIVVLFGGFYGWYRWSRRRKIVISVTTDGLTVDTRRGDVYSFSDAKLGTWGQTGGATMGTALHLQCGQRRFVLGGRDRRVAAGTRLEAPDADYGLPVDVDAWLSAKDFEEILTMVGRRSGLEIRPPAPDEPARCLLFANALLMQKMGWFAFRKRQEFMKSLNQPRLAIDVGTEGIRVIDPNSNALIASVSAAHVTATPVMYRPTQRHWFPTVGHLISDAATKYWSTSPGMRVSIPGMTPLTIGCRDTVSGLDQRFAWPDNVPPENARADYEVSGTDWLTLVEKFGLAPHLPNAGVSRVS
jgi:hypothetical protein